ncbi:hypothetical protein EVAR_44495_1 [Eumeta japonica]|uniref:Uncharacterized protein n=1 Tax=Eumeta variegata TaxID=151549 RepID=A0A4C1WMI6_EUMVA|nr:hypothetical protein EVAR_44495_1 [Eumeta japonica]
MKRLMDVGQQNWRANCHSPSVIVEHQNNEASSVQQFNGGDSYISTDWVRDGNYESKRNWNRMRTMRMTPRTGFNPRSELRKARASDAIAKVGSRARITYSPTDRRRGRRARRRPCSRAAAGRRRSSPSRPPSASMVARFRYGNLNLAFER